MMEKHTLRAPAFANHACLRGWRVIILPDTDARHHQPDVLVERDGEWRYREGMLGPQSSPYLHALFANTSN